MTNEPCVPPDAPDQLDVQGVHSFLLSGWLIRIACSVFGERERYLVHSDVRPDAPDPDVQGGCVLFY